MDTLNYIIVDDDPMSSKILMEFGSKFDFLRLLGTHANILDALNKHGEDVVNLVILDVELPEISGLDYLKNFKHKYMTIMVSAKPEYAVEAFEYDAVDFLLKPLSFSRFMKAMQKIQRMHTWLKKSDLEY